MRTLDDIIPPSKRQATAQSTNSDTPSSNKRGKFPLVTLVITLLIVGGCAGALFYFNTAEVHVTASSAPVAVSGTFMGATGSTELPFEIITAEKIAKQSVASSGTRTVSGSAKGSITIYNTQTVPQKLIASTRFATAGGLIFRIKAPVTVPGAKGGVPGQVIATAYADQSGSNYNIGPSSFTVPGLSGTSQYTQVTAKSTTPMTGGASGNEPVVAPALEASTRATLTETLAPDLEAAIKAQVPEGYVLLSGATASTYTPLPAAPSEESGKADIRVQGTIRAVVFPSTSLAKAIARKTLQNTYRDESVTIADTSTLSLSTENALPQQGDDSFTFTLSGSAELLYSVIPSRIASAIAGKTRAEAEAALASYPEVKRATLILRPFWRTAFPEDPAAIKVTVPGAAGN